MNTKLILRTLISPFTGMYADITKDSVLARADVDNNFIYLKGETIYSASTLSNTVILNKLNGDNITFDLPAETGTITNVENIGSGVGIFNSLTSGNTVIQLNSITGTSNARIAVNVTASAGTINLDVNEQNLILWPLVVNGNQLLSGGASYLSGLTFNVTDLSYIIDDTFYSATSSTVIVASGDSVYDRIDVIIADISGNTSVVQGTPSANPVKPDIDESTQIEVTFVTIAAGVTSIALSSTLVYNEKVGPPAEWVFATPSSPFISGDSTTQTYSGTSSIELSAATNGKSFTLSSSTVFDSTTQNTIQFAIKNRIAWPAGTRIRLSILSSTGIPIGTIVDLYNGRFGFSSSNTTSWQLISIPLSNFTLTTTLFSTIKFLTVNTATLSISCFIDYVRMMEGLPVTTPNPTWFNIRANNGSSIPALTANDTLTISGTSGIGTQVIAPRTLLLTYTGTSGSGTITGITNFNNVITLTNSTGGTLSTVFNTMTGATINGNLLVTGATTLNNNLLVGDVGSSAARLDVKGGGTGYSTLVHFRNLSNVNKFLMFDNGESHFDSGSGYPTTKHTSGRWDFPNVVSIGGPTVGGNESFLIKGLGSDASSYSIKTYALNGSSLFSVCNDGLVTINNILTATTISATTFYGDGSNLTGIPRGFSGWTGSTGIQSIKANNSTANLASGQYSYAEGSNTTASGLASHAEGGSTSSSNNYSHAEGVFTIASGGGSHSEGGNTTSSGTYSHAEGIFTTASNTGSHSEGNYTTASGIYSHAECDRTKATGNASHAEGYLTTASATGSHAEGGLTIASGGHSHAEGESSQASGPHAHAEGRNTIASGAYSHSQGNETIASGWGSNAQNSGTTASGLASHAEGAYTIASGTTSHAEGSGTTAGGLVSHAEGYLTIASGDCSHAEGFNTTASGVVSHVEGGATTASGTYSHAEGNITIASGTASHSEGGNTRATASYSHAEGNWTSAIGDYSHAEGFNTTASGVVSHVEGAATIASGDYSHAGGITTIASGNHSFVHGSASTATGIGTIVLGDGITGTLNNVLYTPSNIDVNGGRLYSGGQVDLNNKFWAASSSQPIIGGSRNLVIGNNDTGTFTLNNNFNNLIGSFKSILLDSGQRNSFFGSYNDILVTSGNNNIGINSDFNSNMSSALAIGGVAAGSNTVSIGSTSYYYPDWYLGLGKNATFAFGNTNMNWYATSVSEGDVDKDATIPIWRLNASRATGSGTSGDIRFAIAKSNTTGSGWNNMTDELTIKGGSGKIGIGTVSPTAKLSISGIGVDYSTSALDIYSSANTKMYNFTDKGRSYHYDTTGTYFLSLEAQGTTGVAEIITNKSSLYLSTAAGEYQFKNTVGGRVLLLSNGQRFDFSATVGGAPNMSLSATDGYLGINTQTPSSPLHVRMNNFGDIVTISPSGGTGGVYVASDINNNPRIYAQDSTSQTAYNLRTVDNCYFTNSISIGVDSSSMKLSVKSNSGSDFVAFTSSASTGGIYFNNSNDNNPYIYGQNNSYETVFSIKTSGNTFFNGGNVGVGTAAPNTKLHVMATLNDGIKTESIQSGHSVLISPGNGSFGPNITSTYALEFKSPSAELRLGRTSGNGNALIYVDSTVTTGLNISANSGGSANLTLLSDGTVGFGTATPTSSIDINASGSTQFRLRQSYTPTSSGDTSGNVGQIAWDNNYMYVKTNLGWGRAALDYGF